MARELAPPREGQRTMVRLTLKRVRPADLARLIEHMEEMAAEWDGEYEITQLPEKNLPEGA
jgi:hypothetical protein